MTTHDTPEITLAMIREKMYSAVIGDALDALGYPNQSPSLQLRPMTGVNKIVGRAKTTLWADMAHKDPKPYELELIALDSCQTDDVLVAAAAGSMRSGIWGELLSTAARNRGCVGAIVDGAVRDVAQMTAMAFPVFAHGTCLRDSMNRQRVIDIDVAVDLGGVAVNPGDLIMIDLDGIIVVPQAVEKQALARAWAKIHDENITRDAIRAGMLATEAYRKYGVL